MATVREAPLETVEAVAALRSLPRADRRLQRLMGRETGGHFSAEEQEGLEALVELSESLSTVRARSVPQTRRYGHGIPLAVGSAE